MKKRPYGITARLRPVRDLQQGFTLLELLIAIALLALLMVGLGSTMMTVAHTQSGADKRLQRIDEERTKLAFLRSVLGSVSSIKDPQPSAVGNPQRPNFFQGDGQSMRWLGVMPARIGAGGRSFFGLQLESNASTGTQDLVLRFAPLPLDNVVAFPQWSQMSAVTLVADVTAFEIAYQYLDQDVLNWSSNWVAQAELPTAISLHVARHQVVWPKTIVAISSTMASVRGGGDEPTFGGTAP